MKRHWSLSGGAAAPRPAGRARPRGAVIGATVALFAAALLAAACSSSSSGPQVASLGGHHGSAAVSSRVTTAQSDQAMLDYARCMRAHGVNQPDPRHIPGHAGLSLVTSATPPPSRAATAACIHFLQPVIQQKTAVMTPARIAALASYARCMRSHDIAMLDPTSSGQLNLGTVPGISSDFGRNSPQFRGADAACRHLLPAGIHDDGTGP
jgi:hypothetical protein